MHSLLLLMLLGSVCAQEVPFVPGNHSVRYFTTAIIADSRFLGFLATDYFDDIMLGWYDSHAEVLEPRALWMKQAVGPIYWQQNAQFLRGQQHTSVTVLLDIMKQTNQTKGVHTYQTVEGCEVRDQNTTFVFFRTAFDGADFLYINTDTMKWVAEMPEAEEIVQARNANKMGIQQFLRDLSKVCDDVRYLLPFANQTLQRKDKPSVRVTERKLPNDSTTLYCHAYGFHPRRVEMKWLKSGAETQAKLEPEQILPNPDGTYQAIVSLNVTAKTQDDYSCLVQHSSLEKDKIMLWERGLMLLPEPGKDTGTAQPGLPIGGIIGVVLALVGLVFGLTLGLVSWQKWRQAETLGERFFNT
ncbi:major histocompatibility complex class I-related gene protein [Microcaecilia unicolor]|uniref:Major histocompatibility complex class I-related gene protein-like n=1 Tax=Microcaecilia unicolor TaxID=1415580 RepID=A0A6P7X4N5_9AMPH|nr:major histocompatibility complex class I-related gene protein-like [Microcaecilia unicolor]